MSLPDGTHFKASEFACHDGTPYPEQWLDRWDALVSMCDAIRDAWGGPLEVVSGYRTAEHNAELMALSDAAGTHQVASGSQHVEGNAADLRPAFREDVPKLHAVVLQLYNSGQLPQLGGIGLYPRSAWIHVDTFRAADGHLRKWIGT